MENFILFFTGSWAGMVLGILIIASITYWYKRSVARSQLQKNRSLNSFGDAVNNASFFLWKSMVLSSRLYLLTDYARYRRSLAFRQLSEDVVAELERFSQDKRTVFAESSRKEFAEFIEVISGSSKECSTARKELYVLIGHRVRGFCESPAYDQLMARITSHPAGFGADTLLQLKEIVAFLDTVLVLYYSEKIVRVHSSAINSLNKLLWNKQLDAWKNLPDGPHPEQFKAALATLAPQGQFFEELTNRWQNQHVPFEHFHVPHV